MFNQCASFPKERGGSYLETEHWHRYQRFLPESMKYKADLLPREEYWAWKNHSVHLDRYIRKNADCKIILVHGAGGNGRVLGPIAVPLLTDTNCDIISPDFPGYGLTVVPSDAKTKYEDWVELLSDLMDKERIHGQKLYLFGLSIGGMLSYHAAARNKQLDGLIVTTLADLRDPKVKDAASSNLFLSRIGIPLNSIFYWLTDPIHLPIRYLSKMELITNDPDFSEVFETDPYAGGGKVSMRFLRTFMSYSPEINPEDFTICPVLMVHPSLDPWTPYELSKEFYDKLKSTKGVILLDGAGHLPYEEPGRTQMYKEIIKFISDVNTSVIE
ncbi:alpha/beta hydrolase [Leptospira sp. GIMC2001]|uniref:alpha/beta hydrolase n=1 Tax=Leptospira sp. GIMC2001 TaxID=1513297 RepID=UPI00234BC363|nr:alpha/beta hydrolase [Leptospira sp. GIMC2001]WCL50157.1 alpha/beta hydrolase [Leptospira sp. GIMC2001]